MITIREITTTAMMTMTKTMTKLTMMKKTKKIFSLYNNPQIYTQTQKKSPLQ